MISYYSTSGADGVDVVVAFDERRDNPVLMADSKHPHFGAIKAGLAQGDESVLDLFDVGTGVERKFQQITDRVTFDGHDIRFDGDVIHNVLAEQLQRALESGEDSYEPLAKFWEKLESNPNAHSREQAYAWLATHAFKITEEGDIVAYKGVSLQGDGSMTSISSGTAFVDGTEHKGAIPNEIGSVVTMPRSAVAHDPSVACHYGLHAGDWSYASDFARGAVLEVHINPRDVVSVPVDCGARKVRTCKYTVVNVVTSEYSGGPVLRPQSVAPSWAGDVGYAVR